MIDGPNPTEAKVPAALWLSAVPVAYGCAAWAVLAALGVGGAAAAWSGTGLAVVCLAAGFGPKIAALRRTATVLTAAAMAGLLAQVLVAVSGLLVIHRVAPEMLLPTALTMLGLYLPMLAVGVALLARAAAAGPEATEAVPA